MNSKASEELVEEAYDSRSRNGFKRIFKNFSFLTVGKVIGDFFTFILFVVISRKFGEEGIGQYSFAVGLSGFVAVFSDFGLYYFTIKEVSKQRDSFKSYFQKIFSLRIVQSVLVLLILSLIVPFLNFSPTTRIIIVIMGVYQIIYCLIDGISAVFIAHEYMNISAGIEASLKILTSMCALCVAFIGGGIVITLFSLPAFAFLEFLAVIVLFRKKFGEIRISFSLNSLIETFKQVLPFGTSDFLNQLYARTDVVLIGFLLGESSAGIYNVGYRIVFFLLFIPRFASITLLPIISKLFHESKLEFRKMYNKSLSMMIIVSLPISVGLALIAPGFIKLVFGPGFSESSVILRILAGLFLITCLSSIMEIFLVASDHQGTRTKCQWIATTISVISNLILILLFGIEGAAVAVMLSSIVLVILFVLKLKPVIGLPDIKSKILISSFGVLIFFMVFSTTHLSIFIIIPGAALIYFAAIIFFKNVRDNEIRMIVDLVRGKETKV